MKKLFWWTKYETKYDKRNMNRQKLTFNEWLNYWQYLLALAVIFGLINALVEIVKFWIKSNI